MCKTMVGKVIGASVALTISALLLVGAFLRQWSAGAGGLVADPMQFAWVAGMYLLGFVFLGIAKIIAYWGCWSKGKEAKKKR